MTHCFSTNHFEANTGKFHLITNSKMPVDIDISSLEILNKEKVKSLEVNLEGRLNFDFNTFEKSK